MAKFFSFITFVLLSCAAIPLFVILRARADAPLLKIKTTTQFNRRSLVFSRDGTRLIGVVGPFFRTWNAQTGAKGLPEFLVKGDNPAQISPDGRYIAVPDSGQILESSDVLQTRLVNAGITLLDAKSGRKLRRFSLPDNSIDPNSWIDRVRSFGFSRDGEKLWCSSRRIFARKERRETHLWKISSGKVLQQASRDFDDYDGERRPSFTFDSTTLLEAVSERGRGNKDASGRLFLVDSFSDATKFTLNFGAFPQKDQTYYSFKFPLTFSPDGKLVATTWNSTGSNYRDGQDGTIYVWNLKSQKLLWKFQKTTLKPAVLAFSPDSRTLAVGGNDYDSGIGVMMKGWLQLRDAQTGIVRKSLSEETRKDKWNQSWKNRQQEFISAIPALSISNFRNGMVGTKPYDDGDSGPIGALAWSPNSARLAASYEDDVIKIWDAR